MALVKVYPKRKCYDPIGNDNKRFTTFFCTFTSCKHIQDYSNTYTSHRRVHFNRNFCGIFCFTWHKRESNNNKKDWNETAKPDNQFPLDVRRNSVVIRVSNIVRINHTQRYLSSNLWICGYLIWDAALTWNTSTISLIIISRINTKINSSQRLWITKSQFSITSFISFLLLLLCVVAYSLWVFKSMWNHLRIKFCGSDAEKKKNKTDSNTK